MCGYSDGGEFAGIEIVVLLEEAFGFFIGTFCVGGKAEGERLTLAGKGVDDDLLRDLVEEKKLA